MSLRESIKNALDHKTLADVDMFEQMIYELVHNSGGGIGGLSGRMGYMGEAGEVSLGNEVCPTNKQAKFGALELFIALVKVPKRDSERFMSALDGLLNRDINHAGVVGSYSSVMSELAKLGKEQNDVNTAVFEGLEDDNRLDKRERLAIAKEIDDVIERAQATKAALVNGSEVNSNG